MLELLKEYVYMLYYAENTWVFSYCPLSEMLCFSSCLFKAPLLNTQSGLTGHIRLNDKTAVAKYILQRRTSCSAKITQMYDMVMSQSHRIKDVTTEEAFNRQSFLWELLLVQTLTLFTLWRSFTYRTYSL